MQKSLKKASKWGRENLFAYVLNWNIILISFPCWLVYNTFMGSYIGMISDSLSLLSVIVGIIRLDILAGRKQA